MPKEAAKPIRKPKVVRPEAWARHDKAAVAYRARLGFIEGKLGR